MLRTFTADQLCLSPLNVRQNAEDANATDALEASIAAHGLLFPLIVHPLHTHPLARTAADAGVTHGVLAGGRRYRAILRLIESGTIAADFPIEAVVRDVPPSEITELSLAENLLRRELRPYEINAAIARAAQQGAAIEEIAARCGQRVQWVRQQLRLGGLHPEIFDAYATGRISIDLASAYGATADLDLQSAAWRHFSDRPSYDHRADRVRAWLKVGDQELARLLAFVGEKAYRDAGGRYELDLFAEAAAHRGRVVDEPLLRQMAEEKLSALRAAIRAACHRPDLRFAAEAPRPGGMLDYALEFEPVDQGDGADRRIELPDSTDIACVLIIGDDGQVCEQWWWNSRKAKSAAARLPAAAKAAPATASARVDPGDHGSRQALGDGSAIGRWASESKQARAVLRADFGLTTDGMQIMRSMRREILRARLLRDAAAGGNLGRDYVIWAQLRQILRGDLPPQVGMLGISMGWYENTGDHESDDTGKYLAEMPAHREWNDSVEAIKAQSFMTLDDPFEALEAFVNSSPALRNRAAAVLAGMVMVRTIDADGFRCRAHDRVAELTQDDGPIREFWQPTAQWLDLFPKATRLEMARPLVSPAVWPSWEKLDSQTLSGALAGALDPDAHEPGPRADAAAAWVHPLLDFPRGEPGSLARLYAGQAKGAAHA